MKTAITISSILFLLVAAGGSWMLMHQKQQAQLPAPVVSGSTATSIPPDGAAGTDPKKGNTISSEATSVTQAVVRSARPAAPQNQISKPLATPGAVGPRFASSPASTTLKKQQAPRSAPPNTASATAATSTAGVEEVVIEAQAPVAFNIPPDVVSTLPTEQKNALQSAQKAFQDQLAEYGPLDPASEEYFYAYRESAQTSNDVLRAYLGWSTFMSLSAEGLQKAQEQLKAGQPIVGGKNSP